MSKTFPGRSLVMASIILTEWDAAFRNVLHSALSSSGYLVVSFRSALEAIQCARLRRADLVILDESPESKGLEACARIRELDAYALVPIILATWNGSAGFRRRAQRAGVSQLLVKPFSNAEILARVHDFVGADERTDLGLSVPPEPALISPHFQA